MKQQKKIHRIYLATDLKSDAHRCSMDLSHRILNVLRIKNYENVNISNGVGALLLGRFVKDHVEINSQKKYSRKNEISIFVPYLREKNRFRFMIEKLVELNVYRLFIGKTQNTQNTKLDIKKIHNWAISAEKSESNFPILANDPHRSLSNPSLRYMAHLVAPGWNVIGGGEPEIPGISIGHNGIGAWGLTVFRTDAEDLYIYDHSTKTDYPLISYDWFPKKIKKMFKN